MGRNDDVDFEDAMGGMAVRPISGGPARARPATPELPPVPAKGKRGGGRGAPADELPPPSDAVAPGVRRELEQSLAELGRLRGELAAADVRAGQAMLEAAAAGARLATLSARLDGLEAERDEALAQREAAARERKAVQRQLAEAREGAASSPSRPSVSALLTARGLIDRGERELVFQGWLDKGRLAEWLEAVDSDDPTALRRFVDERVSLLCGDPGCTAQPGAAELRVAPERCDVCGGSDTRRALEAFIERCAALGITRVRIVGGSPNYHTELRRLTDGDTRIVLKLVRGDARRNQSEAKADQRHSDLVIIWGGTILDHSTSENYDSALGRVLIVAHRGIAGMLLRAAAEL
jgi:hypothetical protein